MDDDDLFQKLMRAVGVSPLGDRRSPKKEKRVSEKSAPKKPALKKSVPKKPVLKKSEKSAPKKPAAPKPAVPKPAVPKPAVPKRLRELPPDEEDALFLAAMQGTKNIGLPKNIGHPPNKDHAPPEDSGRMRRVKPSKSRDAEPEVKLDLHGHSSTEAVQSLERFVVSAKTQRMKTVLVVTGKGLRSESGVSVLKQAVERWLRMRGKIWVRAFSEAPRKLGGSGAYILYLR